MELEGNLIQFLGSVRICSPTQCGSIGGRLRSQMSFYFALGWFSSLTECDTAPLSSIEQVSEVSPLILPLIKTCLLRFARSRSAVISSSATTAFISDFVAANVTPGSCFKRRHLYSSELKSITTSPLPRRLEPLSPIQRLSPRTCDQVYNPLSHDSRRTGTYYLH